MTLEQAVNTSINAALESGVIDATTHAAPIQALRELAKRAAIMSEKDNVTFPTMLKYMQAMGIMPQLDASASAAADKPKASALGNMRGKFRAVS